MEHCRSAYDEDYDKIYSTAFLLYDHFNSSEENTIIAKFMVENVVLHHANDYFERAVIATLSYMIKNGFVIGATSEQLEDNPNLAPGIPDKWRRLIATLTFEISKELIYFATFYIRKKTQIFRLFFTSSPNIGSASGVVAVNLSHCGNQRHYYAHLHHFEVNGLADPDHDIALAYGANIVKKLLKVVDKPLRAASRDEAPTPPTPPSAL